MNLRIVAAEWVELWAIMEKLRRFTEKTGGSLRAMLPNKMKQGLHMARLQGPAITHGVKSGILLRQLSSMI